MFKPSKESTCATCKSQFDLDEGGFIWDSLVFCELCDPLGWLDV